MNIAFDAKRAFHNSRGLGNYSRDVIRLFNTFHPEHNYFLFNPQSRNNIAFPMQPNNIEVTPRSLAGKLFPSLWRSRGMCAEIKSLNIDIYHGLSQELPWGIEKTQVQRIVTMHDAIFMRYPQLYSKTYRSIFIRKNIHACKTADKIIAISRQTKEDLVEFFHADEQKIDIVYQGCNQIFREPVSQEQKEEVRSKYRLPENFILNVGAIEKRKNAGRIIEALHIGNIDMPLVIIGSPTDYKKELESLIDKWKLNQQILFIHNAPSCDLPAIYSMASVFVYPSIFEGFGIPILEALCVGTPVITSSGSCFREAGGPDSLYVNPQNAEELASALKRTLTDTALREHMISQGKNFADNFTDEKIMNHLMKIYLK